MNPHHAPAARRLTTCWDLGEPHLEYVLREFVEHYEEARPHQGLEQRTHRQCELTVISKAGPVERRDLGGMLHESARQGVPFQGLRHRLTWPGRPFGSARADRGAPHPGPQRP